MSGDILGTQQDLINRLRDEVNRAEQTIQQEIERQTEDLGVMRKRMKDHLDSTRATQRCQLAEIDVSSLFVPVSNTRFRLTHFFHFRPPSEKIMNIY